MTLKVALSQVKALPFDFETEVKTYIAALVAHQSTIGEPAPSAPHSLVEHAVKRVQYGVDDGKPDTFVADYEIEDDTPPPPTLDERKVRLAAEASTAAEGAVSQFYPPLRRRLVNMEANAARAVEEKKRTEDQKAAVVRVDSINEKYAAIQWKLARAEAEIHDLTEETIDSWKVPDFSA